MKRVILACVFIGVFRSASAANYPTAPVPYQVLGTSDSIVVKMETTHATVQPTYAIAYVDQTETSTTPGNAKGSFNDTTEVAGACPSPAQGNRLISSITITNIDTQSNTIDVSVANASNRYYLLYKYSLPQNATISLTVSGPIQTGAGLTLPVTVPNGGTGTTSGNSGGVPYYSSTTTMGSSAALTQYGPVYGGGAGAAPVAMAAGTNGQIIVGQSGSAPLWRTLSGDVTINSSGLTTVGTIGGGVGTNGYFLQTNTGVLTWATPTQYALCTSDPAPARNFLMNLTLYDCDVSSGAFNVTLPAAITGVVIWVRLAKQDAAGANVVTIKPNAADGFNGMGVNLPLYLTWEGECVCLASTGVTGGSKGQGWNIIDYTGAPNTLNMAYNGHGIIAQRSDGSSNTSGTYGYGTCDRWKSVVNGTSITHTFTQDTNPNATISNFSQSNYAMKQTVTVTSGTVTFRQFIEAKDALALQNKAAIFSCRVAHDFGSNVNFQLNLYPMATADSGTIGTVLSGGNIGVNVSVATATATTLTTAPVKMGSNMTLGAVLEVVMNTSSTVTSKHIWLGDVVFQPGTANLKTAEWSQQQELARCQRYFYGIFGDGNGSLSRPIGFGDVSTANTSVRCLVKFPVTMRTAPSGIGTSLTNSHYTCGVASSSGTGTGTPTMNVIDANSAWLFFAASFTGSQNSCGFVFWNSSATTSDAITFDADF